jgi:WD40 repeat protein
LTPALVQGSRATNTRQIDDWELREKVFGLANSPDKRYVAIVSSDPRASELNATEKSAEVSGRVLIWDRQAKRIAVTIDQSEAGRLNGASCVAFSSDGKFVATGSAGGGLMTWDAKTGALIRRYSQVYAEKHHSTESARAGHLAQPGLTLGVLISPDSSRVISLGGDGSLRVWRCADGVMERVLRGDNNPAAVFSKDGKSLFVSFGAVIDELEWPSCRVFRHITGHDGRVITLSRPDSGPDILSAATDGTIKRWDTQRCVERWTHGALSEGAVSRNGNLIAYSLGDAIIRLADGRTGKPRGELRGFESHLQTQNQFGPFRSIAVSPDGKFVIASSFTARHMTTGLEYGSAQFALYLWDTSRRRLLKAWSSNNVIAVAFNRAGNRVLEFPYYDSDMPQVIRVRSVPSGRLISSQVVADDEVCRTTDWSNVSDLDTADRLSFAAVVFGKAPGVTQLVTMDESAHIRSSWPLGKQMSASWRLLAATAIGPAAVIASDRELGFWHIGSRRHIRLPGIERPESAGSVAISPNGKSIACVSPKQGVALVWKTADSREPIKLQLPRTTRDAGAEAEENLCKLMFSDDGSRLFAVTDEGVFVWDLGSGRG